MEDLATASDRVHRALKRGLSVLTSNRSKRKLPSEISDRSPFYNQSRKTGAKKVKLITWKTVPCCLASPLTSIVPRLYSTSYAERVWAHCGSQRSKSRWSYPCCQQRSCISCSCVYIRHLEVSHTSCVEQEVLVIR